jgi:hypothetical protein
VSWRISEFGEFAKWALQRANPHSIHQSTNSPIHQFTNSPTYRMATMMTSVGFPPVLFDS